MLIISGQAWLDNYALRYHTNIDCTAYTVKHTSLEGANETICGHLLAEDADLRVVSCSKVYVSCLIIKHDVSNN